MVAPEKIKERQEFGRLFNLELDRIGAPAGRGRIQWVYREIQENRKALVSTQQVRKWVRGIDIPRSGESTYYLQTAVPEFCRLATQRRSTQFDIKRPAAFADH